MTATPNKIDLMARFNDEEWLAEAIRIEEECGGEVSAGYDLSSNLGTFLLHPDRYVQYERLRSLTVSEMRSLLKERKLENGWERARKILDRRLKNPSLNIQERLLNAIEQDITTRKCSSDPTSTEVKSQIRQGILEVLSAEDWQAIESSAREPKTSIPQYTPRERTDRVLIWLSRLNRWEIDYTCISKQVGIETENFGQWHKGESFASEAEWQAIEQFGKDKQVEVRKRIDTVLQELATYFWETYKDKATWTQFDEWIAKEIDRAKSEVKVLRTHLNKLESPEIAIAKSLEKLRDRALLEKDKAKEIPTKSVNFQEMRSS